MLEPQGTAEPYIGRRWSLETLSTSFATGLNFGSFRVPKWKNRARRLSDSILSPVVRSSQAGYSHARWPKPSFWPRRLSRSRSRSRSGSRSRWSRKHSYVAYAIFTLKTGETKLVSSEDGSRLGDVILQTTMSDHRISSYRLIMASTRAILSDGSVGSSGSLGLESALEDVFEESDCSEGFLDSEGILMEVDTRMEIVQEILTTERSYCKQLNSILKTYAEPLRKFSSLTADDHKILFVGIEPILSISAMLTSKLEDALKCWDPASTQIGNLFSSKLWNHYEEFCHNYPKTRKLLTEKAKTDESFLEFCELRRGKSKYSLADLVHLPVQRIPEYDRYLSDLLDETDSSHPDYDDLNRAAARVQKMVRENEEFGTSPENLRMDSIQKRFPNDDLQLRETSSATQKLRSLSARRRSAPGAVLFKTLGNRSKSSGNLLSQGTMGKKEMDIVNPLRRQNSVNRQYLMEGQVEFSKSVQIHDRYLFLFNDLLLVAKQKTSTTFKLKNRVRICEMWISECISDITEIPRPTEKSFVIGWPTTNVVATFKSAESKELWMNKLVEQIEEEREKESHFTHIKLKVVSRDLEQACTLDIDSKMEAKEILQKCLDHFQIPESESGDYQLWVKSGKEDTPYPLVGHEVPFNIKMSHVRDICLTRPDEPIIPADYDRVLEEAPQDLKCQFALKHNKKSPKKSFDDNIGKGFKKNKKSPLMNFFRRNKDDKNNNFTPPGKLFGHLLEDVVAENGLPKSVMEMLRILFRDGPHTTGIFRKSANAKKQKELRQKLDDDETYIDDGEFPPLVIGAVLKEYLRSLPHCLLMEDFYDDWVCLTEETDSPQKLAQIKQLLFKLPIYHFDLLRHLMCVLHHINKNSAHNLMTAYNLAVCIAPSILWPKGQNDPLKTLATVQNPHSIVSYLIEHCAEVFGEETLSLLGEPCDPKLRQDSSTDSDSMHSVLSMPDSSSGGTNRRDDSSIDSLEREVYIGDIDSSPNLAKSHLSPSNLSRDSGLMMSDGQLNEDDNSSVEMLDTYRKGYPRSVSQYMDNEKHMHSSSSFESYCSYDLPKPPPRKNKRKENVEHSPNMERHQIMFSRLSNRSSDSSRPMLSQSLSVDTFTRLDNSSESLKSIENHANSVSAEWQRKHFESPTLHKSASGKHLYIADSSPYITEIELQKSKRDKLVRQSSVTESTPPMSPQSKYSDRSESIDSVLTESTSSYMPRQYSRETDFSEKSWLSEDNFDYLLMKRSQEDSSVDLNTSTNSFTLSQKNNLPDSEQSMKYPNSSSSTQSGIHKSPHRINTHTPVGARRSFPLEEVITSKGSGGSTMSKEAEDIISSPKVTLSLFSSENSIPRPKSTEPTMSTLPHRNSQSTTALDCYNNHIPLKQITKYSAGLGSSPPPRVFLNRSQRTPQKRENNPIRASHDSAIVSQVRKSSLDSGSEMKQMDSISYQAESPLKHHRLVGGSSYELTRSESDGEINRTLTNSPDKARPDQPPCYEQTLQRQHMMTMGIPLQISEEEKKQKEASALAKKLYENSLKKYMEDHLNSPSVQKCLPPSTPSREIVISSMDSDSDLEEQEEIEEEEIYCELQRPEKDPKLLYEASRKAYEQSVRRISPLKEKNLAVPVCNLHRSFSDSAEHINKRNSWNRRSPSRERSPLAQETIPYRGHSPVNNNSKLSYSSSSVSNSSSDTVTDSQSPLSHSRDRSESSPVISRHAFPKAESPSFSKQHTPQQRAQQSRDLSSVTQPQQLQQSARSLSRDSSISSEGKQKEVSKILIRRRLSNELSKLNISDREPVKARKSLTPDPFTVSREPLRESTPGNSVHRDTSKSVDMGHIATNKIRNQQNSKRETSPRDLPWSVKELRSKWDQKRPPPPPYQNPPPFRRLVDDTRASMSSNSSASSTRSGHSTPPPQRPLSVHARLEGGPQRGDSFSSADDSDTCTRYSGHATSSSSEELSQWSHNFTDVSYV